MKRKLREVLYWIVILLLLAGNIKQIIELTRCHRAVNIIEPEIIRDTVKVMREVRIDSVMVPKPVLVRTIHYEPLYRIDTFLVTSTDTTTEYIFDTVQVPVYPDRHFNRYADTIKQDGIYLAYRHLIEGRLLNSHYDLWYPQVSISNKKKTKIQHIAPFHIFTTASTITTPNSFDMGIGTVFTNKTFMLGYTYGFGQKSHHITAGYRLAVLKNKLFE